MPVYLDCNATTPLAPEIRETLLRYLDDDFGNEGSRTHEFGARAKQAVQRARDQVSAVVGAKRDEVVFTSGATESNNLAILGLRAEADGGRRHVITTGIEHKAVLEPLEYLSGHGFEVTLLAPGSNGRVDADAVRLALRPDTGLVSVMHVNNETGVVQPIKEIAALLGEHDAFFHVDAAQGFGKDLEPLRDARIDLISACAHKLCGPKGVGTLVARRRGFEKPPLTPLMFGGGQERGLRPGTLPVPLIVGLGATAKLAAQEHKARAKKCILIREKALAALAPLGALVNGDLAYVMPHVLNVSLPGIDSEAAIVALKEFVAVSNGSACTSATYQPSHVLKAMGLSMARINGALRLSWCHLTPDIDWTSVTTALAALRS
jgi:cysteine desulfurase